MSTDQPRRPAGTPAGGEFANKAGSAPAAGLSPRAPTGGQFDHKIAPNPSGELPTLPPHYGDRGWEYHRNGVAGMGFLASSDGDGGVQVSFVDQTVEDGFQQPIRVPGEIIRRAAEVPVSRRIADLDIRAAVADRFGVTTFDFDDLGTMVAVTDLDADDNEYATAVFRIESLGRGDVGWDNKWRGDNFHKAVLRALRER